MAELYSHNSRTLLTSCIGCLVTLKISKENLLILPIKIQLIFEDSGFVSFDFLDGGMGSLNYSTAVWNQNLESSITIIGSKGSVKVGGQYMNEG